MLEEIMKLFDASTDEERKKIFDALTDKYCRWCGRNHENQPCDCLYGARDEES